MKAGSILEMAKRHFKEVSFQSGKRTALSYSDARYHEFNAKGDVVERNLKRARPLLWHIAAVLRQEKIALHDPQITELIIYLTEEPKPEPWLWLKGDVRAVYVEICYDLFDLEKLPDDNKLFGELFIGWIEEAIERLGDYPQIPTDLIQAACQTYRNLDYSYSFKVGERMIPGTKIKGCVGVISSCVSTDRYLTLLYRNKEMYQMKISVGDGGDMISARAFHGFELENDRLIVSAGPVLMEYKGKPVYANGAQPETIDLNDHPEALELIQNYSVRSEKS